MADYNIKEAGHVVVQAYNSTAHAAISSEIAAIRSLSGKGIEELAILSQEESKPTGCMLFAVSSAASVFLHVNGRLDLEGEITKAQKKMQKANESAARQRQIVDGPGYKEKARPELQDVS